MKKSFLILLSLLLILTLFTGCGEVPTPTPESIPADTQEVDKTVEDEKDSELDETKKAETPTGELKAHFIDVGQGDAILIQTSEQNILIDGGDRGTTVVNYLHNLGVESLDLIIGTHPHADHIGGLINVMESIPVKEVIDPAVVHTTKTFEDYLDVIDRKDIKFTEGRAGMTWELGSGAKIEIIHPTTPSSDHLNNASIVSRITFGDISFMLTGDAEKEAEQKMLNRDYALESTILKVGHHGSRTSTTSSFLSAVDPEAAVIMCGADNQYGHPHDETLVNLTDAGVEIYRTDKHGTIVITSDGQTYDINIKQPYQYTPPKEPEPEEESAANGKYVGSVESDRYHNPNCRHAENISSENEIWFDSVEDAKNKGYTPCGVCRPPQ